MGRASRTVLAGLSAACLAACGSSGYAPSNLPTAAPPQTTAAPAAAAGRPSRVVRMKALAFAPRTITTTAGRPVEWINGDDVRHNVTSLDGTTIASPDLAGGGRFVYVPARPARIRYYCTIHPSTMSGELIVTAG